MFFFIFYSYIVISPWSVSKMTKADQSPYTERVDEWLSNDGSDLVADFENLLNRAVGRQERQTKQALCRVYL